MEEYDELRKDNIYGAFEELTTDEIYKLCTEKKFGDLAKVNDAFTRVIYLTLLYRSVRDGNLEYLKYAINQSEIITKPSLTTALEIASFYGHLEVVKYLVENGAEIKNYDPHAQFSPLLNAGQNNHVDVLDYLIKHGGDRSREYYSEDLLLECLDNYNVVKYLLERGMDANVHDLSNKSLLHFTCIIGYFAISMLLIEYGAKIDVIDVRGDTPLHCAINAMHCDLVDFLLDNNANPNIQNVDGDTPLILAGKLGYIELVWLLCKYDVDVNVKNKEGKSAIDYVLADDNIVVVEFLRKRGAK